MADEVTDEMLMSYVDGGLTDEQIAAVERLLKIDASARQFVKDLQRVSELSRQAYNDPISEPVPRRLIDTILADAGSNATRATNTAVSDDSESGIEGAEPGAVFPFKRRWFPSLSSRSFALPAAVAMAAALTLAVGIGVGMLLISPTTQEPQIAVGPVTPGSELATRLQSLASGTPDNLAPDRKLLIIGTFRDRGGRLCREFEVHKASGGMQVPDSAAVACRSGREGWRIEGAFRLAQPATQTSPDGYVPSGAPGKDTLSGLMSTLGAQPLLSPREEADLISRGWKAD